MKIRLITVSVVFACTVISGCLGTCPEVTYDSLESGTYAVDPETSVVASGFERFSAADRVVEVDRDAGTVTISYSQSGERVVEIYRMDP